MAALIFYIVIPIAAGAPQYFLTRSRACLPVKWVPALAVSLIGLVCFLATTGQLSLPHTYYLSKPSFIAFPDYAAVMLFCLPALFGLGVGAVLALASRKGKKGGH